LLPTIALFGAAHLTFGMIPHGNADLYVGDAARLPHLIWYYRGPTVIHKTPPREPND
jgi:hypothetical protein